MDRLPVFGAAFAAVILRIEEIIALRIAELRLDLGLPDSERVRNVLEEDQPEYRVFVNRGIQIRPEPVGGGPEFLIQFLQKGLRGGVGHSGSMVSIRAFA